MRTNRSVFTINGIAHPKLDLQSLQEHLRYTTLDAFIFDDRVLNKMAFIRPTHLAFNTKDTYAMLLRAIDY